MKRSKRVLLAMMSVAMLVAPVLGRADTYVGGGTAVYKQAGQDPTVDTGVTVCHPDEGTGVGGACLPFSSAGQFIDVTDAVRELADGTGHNVAFQVCIDNNGDGKCVSGGGRPGTIDPCADSVFFSHNDEGRFFNPLGPLPTSRSSQGQCNAAGTGWNGYVVFLCEGAHTAKDGASHSHPATTGTVRAVTDSPTAGQYGDFCGGIRDQVVKEYVVV
jgi:hypothetical protein